MKKIKFLVMDVDGTLTDGKIYIGQSGEIFKAFNIKDGCGIHELAIPAGIIPVIITARTSNIVKNRCDEIGITEVYQGCKNKLEALELVVKKYGKRNNTTYSLADVAYIGDDLPDLKCMKPILENGGVVGCPKDSAKEILRRADYISPHNGGEGAVRDFIEWLLQ
jgi:3-deoxy-D-manno-octulosonate 8-phosphate phosphatase (KDO 8-P phosphatase)